MKMDLILNNLQRLICHKIQTNSLSLLHFIILYEYNKEKIGGTTCQKGFNVSFIKRNKIFLDSSEMLGEEAW